MGQLLSTAGVEIDGPNDCDIQVHNENFYQMVLGKGSLGLGESYMDAWWDCRKLDKFFFKILRGNLSKKIKTWNLAFHYIKARLFNYQKKSKAFEIAKKHYDAGNELFVKMLGKTMVYTCGYWKDAKNLEEAQEAKLDLVCRKIGLKPGMKVLDIGCGFGSFMKFAVEKYKVSAVGVSVSKEQIKFGEELCAGLPVEFKFLDYREVEGKFDRIVSLGMLEHVGYKNYKRFFEVTAKSLTNDGLFLLHTIGNDRSVSTGEPWLDKYIFPNGMLPSIKQLGEAMEGLFILEDLHNFGADYYKTLMAWFANFDKSWSGIKKDYSDRFYRMWKYYLLQCAGIFRARKTQLWQMVLSKEGVLGGYESIR